MSVVVQNLLASQAQVAQDSSLQQASVAGYPIGVECINAYSSDVSNVDLPVMAPSGLVYFQGQTVASACTLPSGSSMALGQSVVVINDSAVNVVVSPAPPDKLADSFVIPLTAVASLTLGTRFYSTFTWTGGASDGGQGYWMRSIG